MFLSAQHLSVRFGGLRAVDDVSLEADVGAVIGVIGPNGAGKTTLFGAILGSVPAERGTVAIGGADVSSWPPFRRAQLGVGRTFQRLELFGSMTVRESLEFAALAPTLTKPWRLLQPARRRSGGVVDDVLGMLGLAAVADAPSGTLPTGLGRLVEFGRALCAGPHLLLLDEPSSGLDAAETEAFGNCVLRTCGQIGVGIVLIEHDMNLVRQVCPTLHVLDAGRLIASGPTAEVTGLDSVRQAYLGAAADV